MFTDGSEAGELRLCIAGVSGLVGTSLVAEGSRRPDVRLSGVIRREVPLPPGARIELVMAEPADWAAAIARLAPAVVVCTLGTTRARAGSQAAFRAVDVDLVVAVARAAKAAGADRFILVSSVGANAASRSDYLRAKGDAESAVVRVGFRRLDIVRPGLLVGPRHERRPLEWLAQRLAPLTDAVLWGKARRFRSIRADRLARALLGLAREKAGGRFIHEHDSLLRAERRSGG